MRNLVRRVNAIENCASRANDRIARGDFRLRPRQALREYEVKSRVRKAVSSWVSYALLPIEPPLERRKA
jgi:hypothetical protein